MSRFTVKTPVARSGRGGYELGAAIEINPRTLQNWFQQTTPIWSNRYGVIESASGPVGLMHEGTTRCNTGSTALRASDYGTRAHRRPPAWPDAGGGAIQGSHPPPSTWGLVVDVADWHTACGLVESRVLAKRYVRTLQRSVHNGKEITHFIRIAATAKG